MSSFTYIIINYTFRNRVVLIHMYLALWHNNMFKKKARKSNDILPRDWASVLPSTSYQRFKMFPLWVLLPIFHNSSIGGAGFNNVIFKSEVIVISTLCLSVVCTLFVIFSSDSYALKRGIRILEVSIRYFTIKWKTGWAYKQQIISNAFIYFMK